MHLEGRASIEAAIAGGRRRVLRLLLSRDADEEKLSALLKTARAAKIPVKRVPSADVEAVAHARSHGGVVAECSDRPPDPPDAVRRLVEERDPVLLLLVDGADDPRHLGHILRTAEALGVHGVILKKHAWDVDTPDLVRTSSGSFERLCVARTDREDGLLEELRERGVAIVGCVPNVLGTIHEAALARPVVLAVGGEKRGLSGYVRGLCTAFARIPSVPGAPALTLVAAAAIAIAEAARQRSASRR